MIRLMGMPNHKLETDLSMNDAAEHAETKSPDQHIASAKLNARTAARIAAAAKQTARAAKERYKAARKMYKKVKKTAKKAAKRARRTKEELKAVLSEIALAKKRKAALARRKAAQRPVPKPVAAAAAPVVKPKRIIAKLQPTAILPAVSTAAEAKVAPEATPLSNPEEWPGTD
jgi:hypothetical protein